MGFVGLLTLSSMAWAVGDWTASLAPPVQNDLRSPVDELRIDPESNLDSQIDQSGQQALDYLNDGVIGGEVGGD